MELERKRLPFSLKADEPGGFRAVFSTLDVEDHDGDVTLPGAFDVGTPVIVGSWGHKDHELPVGKGVIAVTGAEVAVDGTFFLDTAHGQATYQTVKNLGDLGEWSYIYSPEKVSYGQHKGRSVRFLEKVRVYSVDPVLAGAGINTRTTDIKSRSSEGFADHAAEIAAEVEQFVARVKSRLDVRMKAGRTFSQANVDRLSGIAESLKTAAGDLESLLESSSKSDLSAVARELARWQLIRADLRLA